MDPSKLTFESSSKNPDKTYKTILHERLPLLIEHLCNMTEKFYVKMLMIKEQIKTSTQEKDYLHKETISMLNSLKQTLLVITFDIPRLALEIKLRSQRLQENEGIDKVAKTLALEKLSCIDDCASESMVRSLKIKNLRAQYQKSILKNPNIEEYKEALQIFDEDHINTPVWLAQEFRDNLLEVSEFIKENEDRIFKKSKGLEHHGSYL